jgi:hypothetical protein
MEREVGDAALTCFGHDLGMKSRVGGHKCDLAASQSRHEAAELDEVPTGGSDGKNAR